MSERFLPRVDRTATASVTQQIVSGIRTAIQNGTMKRGSRLFSWQDLAAQLGVSRGTVKRAYDLLKDEGLLETRGSGGTWVVDVAAILAPQPEGERHGPAGLFYDFEAAPQYFQLGVPAQDEFPAKAWHTAWRQAIAMEATRPQIYPDPRGLSALRHEVASYLATARRVQCLPRQVFITSGYSGALGIVLNAMGLHYSKAFVEEPGFPRTRQALQHAGIKPIPAPVDAEGIDPPWRHDVKLAVVTPGQQAPLGVTMSANRRAAFLRWASETGAWIIEDDYAGELQLTGRASPALAAADVDGRVFHIGSFSKTLNPGLRIGYLVVPLALVEKFEGFVGHLAPAGPVVVQQALQNFMSGGHYYRHLRRMKKLYAERKTMLVEALRRELHPSVTCSFNGALSVRLFLPPGTDDVALAAAAQRSRLGVLPLSEWYQSQLRPSGLLLGIANVRARDVVAKCAALSRVLNHRLG